jgi:hypothetical protein
MKCKHRGALVLMALVLASCESEAGAGKRRGSVTDAGMMGELPAASIVVTPRIGRIFLDETLQLSASVRDKNQGELRGRPVSWQSSDPTLATVDANGLVTGLAAGNVTLSAHFEALSAAVGLRVAEPIPTVSITSLHDKGVFLSVSKLGSQGSLVVASPWQTDPQGLPVFRPQLWAVFADGTTLRMSTSGSREQPNVTLYEYGGVKLRVEDVDASGRTVATFVDADGTELRHEEASLGVKIQAATDKEAEQDVDETFHWIIDRRAHPIVDVMFKLLEAADAKMKAAGQRLENSMESANQWLKDLRPESGRRLYTDEAIGSEGDPDPTRTATEAAAELDVRWADETPTTHHLPERVSEVDSTRTKFVETRYVPMSTRCVVDGLSASGALVSEQYTCTRHPRECYEAGGLAMGTDAAACPTWCQELGGKPAIQFQNYDPVSEELTCIQRECVQQTLRAGFQPLTNLAACAAGCVHDSCKRFCEQLDGFRCANGDCIRASQVCNSTPDCSDGSDERNALCSDEGSCCQATLGCPGETGDMCANACCCCPEGQACCADRSGCCAN